MKKRSDRETVGLQPTRCRGCLRRMKRLAAVAGIVLAGGGGLAGQSGAGKVKAEAGVQAVLPSMVLLVRGADGAAEYQERFDRQIARWQEVCAQGSAQCRVQGATADIKGTVRDQVQDTLASLPAAGPNPLWLVLIGHGTFDGHEARFNLPGPDLTATDLAAWLGRFTRPLIVINTTAASAPFLPKLAGTNRVVITATRSGYEQSYAHFGEQLARTIADPAADLDQDGQTSLLEAFLSAAARVKEFYQAAGRLASEHALIDDNGDGLGTPAEWFRGLRATRKPQEGKSLDGRRAHQLHLVYSAEEARLSAKQRAQRDALERQVFALRKEKETLAEPEYFHRLETLLLELARLYAIIPAD